MAWTQVFDDTFGRADTTTGGAGTTTGAGNGSIDVSGGLAHLASGKLQLSTTAANGFLNQYLRRPSGEAALGQRATVKATYPFGGGSLAMGLRTQTNGDYYLFQAASTPNGNQQVYIYSVVGGGVGQLVVGPLSPAYVSGHVYVLDCYASGNSPTTLVLQVRDITAGSTVASITVQDSASSLQTAGVAELTSWVGQGDSNPAVTNISEWTTYTGSPPPSVSLALSPSSSNVGGGAAVTLTATLTNSSGALTASVSGGGALSTTAPTSGTAFTYTAPSTGSGTATVTVADATDTQSATSTITYSGGAITIAVSPTSVTAGTSGVVLAVSGTGTSLNGSSFALSGGLGAVITAQGASSATAGTVTINPGAVGYGNLTLTEARSGATASLAVVPPALGVLVVGALGDSITAGTNGDSCGALQTFLNGQGYTATVVNRGIGGTSTADWLPGSANLNNAISAFLSAGVTLVQVGLATNDPRSPNFITPAQHAANMRLIVGALKSAGFQVLLHHPIYTVPNATINGVTWPANVNDWYRQAWSLDMALVDGVSVMAGDTGAFQASAISPGSFLEPAGIHPANQAQNTLLAQYWGLALMNRGASMPNRAAYF